MMESFFPALHIQTMIISIRAREGAAGGCHFSSIFVCAARWKSAFAMQS